MVLGFAAVDLNVLFFGMPSVSGWFNIMDYAGRCNGQMKVSFHSSCFTFKCLCDKRLCMKHLHLTEFVRSRNLCFRSLHYAIM